MVGITGSTGKTSTKDILLALAGPPFGGRVHANRENFNTEIGLPLTVLEAERGHRGCWCSRWRCAAWGRSASWRGSRGPTWA